MSQPSDKDTSFPVGKDIPAQVQRPQPGLEHEMKPRPVVSKLESPEDAPTLEAYKAAGKLQGKLAIVTGGDSGIGRAVCVMYAKEGADVALTYVKDREEVDAKETAKMVEREGRRCFPVPVDYHRFGTEEECQRVVKHVLEESKRDVIDILVNNAAEVVCVIALQQHITKDVTDIKADQIEHTFRINVFSMFYLVKHTLPHMRKGASIINTTSVTAYRGSPSLLDYSATKGAIVSFTRSLALQVASKGIRVNAVAPGPIWTPLQVASRDDKEVEGFGDGKVPLGDVAWVSLPSVARATFSWRARIPPTSRGRFSIRTVVMLSTAKVITSRCYHRSWLLGFQ
ncbi:oxidoreductase [Jimgerdemannia flammicorona]|uniref:Oxidoreductase n=1 Tax=Jimgerdemannia flammicorona TaxID=994334 RepID=A0A433DKI2_9FUNG|nr:oxidoreductase [Jimgerdemannia flammicorona]